MTLAAHQKPVTAFFEAGNRGEMDTCFGLLADDIIWTNVGTTSLSGTYRGKAELMKKLLGPLFGQLKAGIQSRVHRLLAEGDHVVVETSGQAETHDGRAYDNSYCWIVRLRDGQFVEVTEYADTALIASVFDR